MNVVILRGNLTRDVELRTTQNDNKVAKFGIAVRREIKNSEGNYDSDFFNCIAFGKLAETIDKYFHKGSGIIIEGHIQTGSYEKEDGTKVFTTDIVVGKIEFDRKPVESKKEDKETEPEMPKEDPYEAMGKQIEMEEVELPW